MNEKEIVLNAIDSICKLICYNYVCEKCPLSIKVDVGQEEISICDFLFKAYIFVKGRDK